MRRASLFFAVTGASAAGLALSIAWYLGSYQRPGGSVTGMMGQMIGVGSGPGTLSPMPGAVWGSVAALLLALSIGVVGAAYYSTFPEIRSQAAMGVQPNPEEKQEAGVSWSALVRTSKPDERRVLEVLASHDGRYLQKFIVKESGLSRLKTHRILSRFAERGIVSAEKSGNTNEIALAPWLHPDAKA